MKLILALILAEKKEKRKKKKKLVLAQVVRDVGRRSGRQRRLGGQGRVRAACINLHQIVGGKKNMFHMSRSGLPGTLLNELFKSVL